MRIAQVGPVIERVPPKRYGGTERVVHTLTEELVRRGHDVTLFASGDSLTSAKIISVYPKNLREAKIKDLYGANTLSLLNCALAYERQDSFDIIHDHNGSLGLGMANIARTPSVMTMHGPFTVEMKRMFNHLRRPHIVSISKAQGKAAYDLNHIGTVHNGLSMRSYPFSDTHDGYLLFVGRISHEKGVHNAIRAAQQLNLPLIIAAKLDLVDRSYYYEQVEPYLSDDIRWIGEVDEDERNRLMSRALCFLHPIVWEEPFGLTLIEAMACGCPVVAYGRGSIPEIIKNKKTGFVVKDLEGMLHAINQIHMIDRKSCRRYALRHFNEELMADGYEEIYKKVIEHEKGRTNARKRYETRQNRFTLSGVRTR